MVQLAVAAWLVRMNADNASSVTKLIDAAQQSFAPLANVAAGLGTNLDVSARARLLLIGEQEGKTDERRCGHHGVNRQAVG